MAVTPNTLNSGEFSQHRKVTGTPVVADPAIDGNNPSRRGLLNCAGYDTLIAHVILTGGAAPVVDLEPVIYDADADVFAKHAKTGNLKNGESVEILVTSGRVFLRIDSVGPGAGEPTAVEIRVMPGVRSRKDS